LCRNHPRILAGKWKRLAFPSTAIFSRFPNKNPVFPTLAKNKNWTAAGARFTGYGRAEFAFLVSPTWKD
jgi:hypothetical protein